MPQRIKATPKKIAVKLALVKGPAQGRRPFKRTPAKTQTATTRALERNNFSKRGKSSGNFFHACLKANHQNPNAKKPLKALKLSKDSEEFQADKSTQRTPKKTKRSKKSRRKAVAPGDFRTTEKKSRVKTKRADQAAAQSKLKRIGTGSEGIKTQAAQNPKKLKAMRRPEKVVGNLREPAKSNTPGSEIGMAHHTPFTPPLWHRLSRWP